jgi:hypothetical protein
MPKIALFGAKIIEHRLLNTVGGRPLHLCCSNFFVNTQCFPQLLLSTNVVYGMLYIGLCAQTIDTGNGVHKQTVCRLVGEEVFALR